jgi:hypothetical protein
MTARQQLLIAILLALYALLLKLYPRLFREAFADEMTDVFTQRIEEMAQGGLGKLFRFCVHEYADLFRLLLAERWNQLRQRGRKMKEPVNNVPARPLGLYTTGTPSSWAGALLAGLPHLLVPAFFLTGWLLRTFHIWGRGPDRNSMEIGFAVLVALMLLVAWLRGWPRWSGSWAGYASASLFILLLSALSYLFNAFPLLAEYAAIVENAPILVWLVLSIVMVVLLARRDPLAGLLAILSIFLLFTKVGLDEVRGDEPLFLGIALVTAAVAMLVARTRQLFVGLGLVLATHIPITFLVSYYSIYRSTSLPVEPYPGIVIRQAIASLIFFSLWLIPILLLFAWRRLSQPS